MTETWYVTFGLGTRHAGTYTEIVVDTVEAAEGYRNGRDRVPGETVSVAERATRVREAAVESYGTAWAFTYMPEQYAASIKSYDMRLRERIGARRPDGSLVPVNA